MSETFDSEMTTLRADVAAQSTVIASATEAFRGLAAQLVAAEAAAKNAGATDTQVAGVTNLRQQLEANTASLAAAIPANTDVATPANPAPSPTPAPVNSSAPAEPSAAPAPVTAPALPVTSTVVATAPVPTSAPIEAATTSATEAAALAANQAR